MKQLLVIPLIVISTSLFAQSFQIGLKGGLNVSNFTGSTVQNVDKKALLGFHGGGFLSLLFSDNFAIQPELLFSTQGARVSTVDGDEDWKVNYLNLPIELKFRFPGGFYLEAGPQFGFKLSENIPNQSTEDFANNVDFSVNGGLGFHGKSGFGFGARYVVGISKVGNLDASDVDDANFKNGVAQVFLFYTLFNNKKTP